MMMMAKHDEASKSGVRDIEVMITMHILLAVWRIMWARLRTTTRAPKVGFATGAKADPETELGESTSVAVTECCKPRVKSNQF